MALVVADRVKETTTTTGTGTITLAGASTGYQSFSAIGNGNQTYYTIAEQLGSDWEVGIGTYTSSGTTLSRDTVLSSSNSGSLVNFGAGIKDVFVTQPAGRTAYVVGTTATFANSGIVPTSSGGTGGSSAQAGMNNLAGAVTSGYYLRGNGTNVVMAAISAGDVPTLNQNTTGYAYTLYSQDIRTLSPSSTTAYRLTFGFTSWANNNTSPYADYLALRSYSDSSGGNDNLLMLNKSSVAMRVYQQAWGSASAYSTYADVLMSNNYYNYALPLSAGPSYPLTGTLYISPSGTAINLAGQSDTIGYNTGGGYGTYIKGTGSTYIYGGGLFYDGSTTRTLLHSGNYSSYALPLSGGSLTGSLTVNTGLQLSSDSFYGYVQGVNGRDLYLSADTTVAVGTKMYLSSNNQGVNNNSTLRVNGDITSARGNGASGVIYLGNSGSSYVYYDGANYYMPSGQLDVNGNRVLNAGNYSSYALPLSGGTVTGTLNLSGDNYARFGPNSTWSAYLRVGGNGRVSTTDATVATTNGNLHLDSSNGNNIYLNYYAGGTVYGPSGVTMLSSSNYSSYALPLSGGSLTGTLNVNNGYSFVAQGYNNNGGFALNNASSYWGLIYNYSANDWRLGYGSTVSQIGWNLKWDASGNVDVNGNLSASDIYGTSLSTNSGVNSPLRVVSPGGASSWNGNGSITGAIKIRLPQGMINTMMRMTVRVYTYDGLSFDIYCGGYNYSSGSNWYNTFAYMGTQARGTLNVRFGFDGTYACIYIGETSTSWSYAQVFVTDFQAGYSNYNYTLWRSGWDITFETFFANVTSTQTAYPGLTTNTGLSLSGGTMTGRIYTSDWIEYSGYTGLYSPNNGAHFYVNNASYGAWRIAGQRNGWGGLEFDGSTTQVSMMIETNGDTVGWHANSYGWKFRVSGGTAYVYKNYWGGGTSATVLDSSNYSSYALPLSGGTMGGTIYGSSGVYYLMIGQYGGAIRGYLYNDNSGFGLLNAGGNWFLRNIYSGSDGYFAAGLGTGGATPSGFFGNANAVTMYNPSGTMEVRISAASGATILEYDNATGTDWHVQNSGGVYYITQTSVADRFYINGAAVTIPGSLSKGSGTFDIPHPTVEGKRLRHSFVEGPRVDLIYRGHVTLVNGTATLNMDTDAMSDGGQTMTPGTFEALTRDADIFVQNLTGWEPLKASIQGATLTIVCKDTTSTDTVSWMVVAERKDEHLYDPDIHMTDEEGRMILEYDDPKLVTASATAPAVTKIDIFEGL